jgi:hypothetical protein
MVKPALNISPPCFVAMAIIADSLIDESRRMAASCVRKRGTP